MRRELGGQLAQRRKAAGYLQRELAIRTGYSRTAIANAETGGTKTGRQLWERADQVLGTGDAFARGYDRIQAQLAAESRPRARPLRQAGAAGQQSGQPAGLRSPAAGQARQAYLELGWPAEEDPDGRLWLVTGTGVDALEVPRQAGIVAMSWWLYTRGVPDDIRGLPALPDPAGALAMIVAGRQCYFLVRSGAWPWASPRADPAGPAGPAGPAAVRWHAAGGRVPAPPSLADGGARAEWAHFPAGNPQLVSPMALLHVLAQATAATIEDAVLILPGGVRAVPASAAAPG